ncbi:MAG: RNA-binding protein [Clostridia bacterium]|nr:RNA-binding protein [Clostridia bacterium]
MISYNSLTEEDHLFLSKAEDCARAAEKYKTPQFTKFISPHERVVFEQFFERSPFVEQMVCGGFNDAERSIIGFFPDFIEPVEALFPISVLRIKAHEELGHRTVLGSVLGLGIERSLLGDIIPQQDGAILFCVEPIADFIRMNLTRVGRVNVTVQEAELSSLNIAPKQTKEFSGTVASLRLDAVLGFAIGKSRAKTQDLISAGQVQLNWTACENPSESVAEGDMLSVRGMGRMKVISAGGETKKGRIRIVIEQYI